MVEVNPVLANITATTQSVDKRLVADQGHKVVPATTVTGSEAKTNNKRAEEAKVVAESKESREVKRDEEHLPQKHKKDDQPRGRSVDLTV